MRGVRLVRRFLNLSPLDRRVIVLAVIQLGWVTVLGRLVSFQSLVRQAQAVKAPDGYTPTAGELRQALLYARWIDAAARRPLINAQCLQRSLALHRWLQREGIIGVLRIGVWKGDDALHAHAWIELGNQVVNDQPAAVAPFTPLAQTLQSLAGQAAHRNASFPGKSG